MVFNYKINGTYNNTNIIKKIKNLYHYGKYLRYRNVRAQVK